METSATVDDEIERRADDIIEQLRAWVRSLREYGLQRRKSGQTSAMALELAVLLGVFADSLDDWLCESREPFLRRLLRMIDIRRVSFRRVEDERKKR